MTTNAKSESKTLGRVIITLSLVAAVVGGVLSLDKGRTLINNRRAKYGLPPVGEKGAYPTPERAPVPGTTNPAAPAPASTPPPGSSSPR